jgi:hypothetical protein
MAQMRIDAYEVFYSANGFPPRIALKNAGNEDPVADRRDADLRSAPVSQYTASTT